METCQIAVVFALLWLIHGVHMKIDRLIGILAVLLQQDMVTAPELAERRCRSYADCVRWGQCLY